MELKQKRGISLIILVISIIIMIILSGTIITSINISTENASFSVFANDLAQLQESAKAMYIMEERLPVIDNAVKISRTDILDLVDITNKTLFEEELNLNKESENTFFYQLDLVKAGAGNVDNGTGIKGTDDIYVISVNSLKVYYLKGVKYDGNTYFSINSKMTNIITLPENLEDESEVSISVSEPEIDNNDTNNNVAPTIEIISTQEYSEFSVINGRATGDSIQIKYDYKNYNGIVNNLDEQYMKNSAKSTSVEKDGTFSLKIPKGVNVLTIAVLDKLGNIVMIDVNL